MKSIFKSKTFYFGALWLAVGIAGIFGYADYQPSPQMTEVFALLNGAIIIALRYFTSKSVR